MSRETCPPSSHLDDMFYEPKPVPPDPGGEERSMNEGSGGDPAT